MPHILDAWGRLTWNMISDSALLLLFGFVLAGVIRAMVTPSALSKIFGHGRLTQIFTASLIGVPLPLCSCSVLPVAAQLRRSGLSREGTVSFLISTPETGADSIALSIKLLGPIFAIARPIAALITALFSGLMAWIFVADNPGTTEVAIPQPMEKRQAGFARRLGDGQIYVMTDMLPELAYYLFWGYLLAGLAAALIPVEILRGGVSAWLQYLAVIAVGLPMYVCATSSTPLAAVFLGLGLAPGAVLTFLLVGPATNLTSLMVQKQILGLKGTILMTLSIIVCAVGCGIALDVFWSASILPGVGQSIAGDGEYTAWYDISAGVALSIIMVYFTGRHYYKKIKKRFFRHAK